MATLMILADLASIGTTALNILWVAVGLGLVIFFHELGHFAVAKWCNVYVERFSIGFGPVLWSFKRGETEYALSLIPFGGYVKMLGQDDMDPSQLTSDEIALDPRSYSAKSVPQRMAIISAGVIMNLITAILFFAAAFMLGYEMPSNRIGHVQVGSPAWEAGLEADDELLTINGSQVDSFHDVQVGVALTTGEVRLTGKKLETGEPFDVIIKPRMEDTRRVIGIGPAKDTKLADEDPTGKSLDPVADGLPGADAGLEPGDRFLTIEGEEVTSFAHLRNLFSRYRDRNLNVKVLRKDGTEHELTIASTRMRTLGLKMDIGQVAAIRKGSPAAVAGFEKGDKIARISDDGGKTFQDVGKRIDPLILPYWFADHHGQEVVVEVRRKPEDGEEKTETLKVTPLDKPGWVESPTEPGSPLSVPALGLAFHMQRVVLDIDPDGPLGKQIDLSKGLVKVDKLEFILPEGKTSDDFSTDKTVEIKLDGEEKNWVNAFWSLQVSGDRLVRLTYTQNNTASTVDVTPSREEDSEWSPIRGIVPAELTHRVQTNDPVEALGMAWRQGWKTTKTIYLTIRNLVTQHLSVKELHGPIGIAKTAYRVAEQGIAELLMFLGFLSINLAVLNFLPIPLLDGGHMVFLIWEGVTRRKPTEKVIVAASYCGMLFVLSLMALVIYLDIFVH